MTAPEILAGLPNLSVLIVGDLCLDAWCRYDPHLAEPSRETGIPRIAVVQRNLTPGAAGTVAANAKALGVGQVSILSAIGQDGHAFELLRALNLIGIEASEIIQDRDRPTFTYTKLINAATAREDLPRIDFIPREPLSAVLENKLIERLNRLAAKADVIIVSDQAETDSGGVVTPRIRTALSSHDGKLIWVDSRKRGEHFRGMLVKLNEQEASECCRRALGQIDYQGLRRLIGHPYLIVTQGAAGATIFTPNGSQAIPAQTIENPVDICGAGDSFNAAAAPALALTKDIAVAVRFGNLVASITITKPGTGTASPEEVRTAAHHVIPGLSSE